MHGSRAPTRTSTPHQVRTLDARDVTVELFLVQPSLSPRSSLSLLCNRSSVFCPLSTLLSPFPLFSLLALLLSASLAFSPACVSFLLFALGLHWVVYHLSLFGLPLRRTVRPLVATGLRLPDAAVTPIFASTGTPTRSPRLQVFEAVRVKDNRGAQCFCECLRQLAGVRLRASGFWNTRTSNPECQRSS